MAGHCEYKDCCKLAKYELFWRSYDDKGKPSKPDTNNLVWSCASHLLKTIDGHEFGPPVDDILLIQKNKSLPKLTEAVNKKLMNKKEI